MAFALKTHKSAGIRVTWPVHRLIAKGNRARDERDWCLAAEAYRDALERDGALAHIWVQLGHMLRELQLAVDAVDAYRAASELRPDWCEPFLYLGHLARLQGDMAEAVRFYALAARADPAREEGLIELAATLAALADGSGRVRLRGTLGCDAEGDASETATLVLDISGLVDGWLHGDALSEEGHAQLSLLAAAEGVRLCCMTADRNEWVDVPADLLPLLPVSDDARSARRVTDVRLRLMAADPIALGAGSVLIGLGAPVRLDNYFLSIRAMQRSVGLRYVACLPGHAPPAEWLAEARHHASGFLVASEAMAEAIGGDRVKVMSFGAGWPVEAAGLAWPAGPDPVPVPRLGQWHGVERFRAGQGWHVPDAGGCRTQGEGGELALRLPDGVRAPRLYLRLRALPRSDCRYRLRIERGPRIEGIVRAGLDKWIAVDVPVEAGIPLRLFLIGDRQEIVPMEVGRGLTRRSASLGVVGFCVIEQDDETARRSLLEAIEGGEA